MLSSAAASSPARAPMWASGVSVPAAMSSLSRSRAATAQAAGRLTTTSPASSDHGGRAASHAAVPAAEVAQALLDVAASARPRSSHLSLGGSLRSYSPARPSPIRRARSSRCSRSGGCSRLPRETGWQDPAAGAPSSRMRASAEPKMSPNPSSFNTRSASSRWWFTITMSASCAARRAAATWQRENPRQCTPRRNCRGSR